MFQIFTALGSLTKELSSTACFALTETINGATELTKITKDVVAETVGAIKDLNEPEQSNQVSQVKKIDLYVLGKVNYQHLNQVLNSIVGNINIKSIEPIKINNTTNEILPMNENSLNEFRNCSLLIIYTNEVLDIVVKRSLKGLTTIVEPEGN